MDIFGTIVSAIDLTKQIRDYLQAVRNTDNERWILCAEISELLALLNILQQTVSDLTDRSGLIQIGIQPTLKQCLSALRIVNSKLKVLKHGSRRLDKLVKKLESPFCQDEIQEALKKIKRLKSLISLSLQTSLKKFFEETEDDLAVIDVDVSGLDVKLSRLEKKQTDHNRQTKLYMDGMYLSAYYPRSNSQLVTFSEKKLQEITD